MLNIPASRSAGQVAVEDALENLFSLEKALVFRTLREVLGVELTPAEEQAILENRAQNVLAFLAYGRGLRERDRGNYRGALAEFQQAQQLDPGFDAAGTAADEASALEGAATTSTNDMAQTASTTGETGGAGPVSAPPPSTTGAVPAGTTPTTPGTSGTLNNVGEGVDPTPTTGTLGTPATPGSPDPGQTPGEKRDPLQEATGQDNPGGGPTAQIRIVIRRPGSGS